MRIGTASLVCCLLASPALAQLPCFDANYGTPMVLASGTADDGFSAVLPLGFSFVYGGVSYTDISVCTNGYVVLGAAAPLYQTASWSPTCHELVNDGEAKLAPLWTDLSPQLGGGVWHNAVPAGGGNPAYFSVTWDACPQFQAGNSITVQLLLIDGGAFQFTYGADFLSAATEAWALGASPGTGGPLNPVSFESLPFSTNGNPTLHRGGNSAPPEALADQVFLFTPDGLGGFDVTNGTGCADVAIYGAGCVARYRSFYEHFDSSLLMDLGNTSLTAFLNGNEYVVSQGLSPFVPPSATALNLGIPDEGSAMVSLSMPLPYPGGSASTLYVGSNGYVSPTDIDPLLGGYSYKPDPVGFLDWPDVAWAVWHDWGLDPTSADNVYFEEVGGLACITFSNVPSYDGAGVGSFLSTFQFQFDLASGTFHLVFQTMDNVSVSSWLGADGYLVGFTAGSGAANPGNTDLTTVANGSRLLTTSGFDQLPLRLAAAARPVGGSTVDLYVSDITATAPVVGVVYGFVKYPAGISLAAIGMPDCFQYNDMLGAQLLLPAGAPMVTAQFAVPPVPGLMVQAQAAAYDPLAAQTPFGAVSSRGLQLSIGN